MIPLAPLIESFFLEHLHKQLQASPNTVLSYRDTFRLLLRFAQQRLAKMPSDLEVSDLDAAFIAEFLAHVEEERKCQPQTRNQRLTAVRSFANYVAFVEPACVGVVQRLLGMPRKRCDRNLVPYLTRGEMEALLSAPERSNWLGRRDYALLLIGMETGLRVSEVIHLCPDQITLKPSPYIQCRGKGRKERCVPLTRRTSSELDALMRDRAIGPKEPVFQKQGGGGLSPDAVQKLVKQHALKAGDQCPSIRTKRVSPHVLRHTAAMRWLESGASCALIALLLGHESSATSDIYLHSNLELKERVIARVAPIGSPATRRFKPTDHLLEFLNRL
jgi:integrase/recombinase XerD